MALDIILDEIAPQIGGVTKAEASAEARSRTPAIPPDPDAMKEKDEKEKEKKKKENAVDEKSSASKLVWKGD
jgi:ribosomal protein L12E/L44/L45/RPP1/RPP2